MNSIKLEIVIDAPVDIVWDVFNNPEHVVNWNYAADSWHCPNARADFKVGGEFAYEMAARDGSVSFDFGGVFDEITEHEKVIYTLGDGRRVEINFEELDRGTKLIETFETEDTNTQEQQRAGWQAILDNFKKYAEGLIISN